MTIQTTYTQARAQLAGLLETVHLLRSPVNAERLLTTLSRVRQRIGTPQTIDQLRAEVGLHGTD